MKNGIETLQKTCTELKTENDNIKNKSTNKNIKQIQNNNVNVANINSNNTTNITNNIVIVPFGTENLTKIISNTQCNKFLERGISAITELIKHVHFNKNMSE